MFSPRIPLEAAAYRPDLSPTFLQWWYFDAAFDDGHHLMVILQPRMIGRLEGDENGPVPGALITITTPRRKNLKAREYFAPEAVTGGRGEVLCSLGASAICVEGSSLRLTARAGKLGVDLRFDPRLPPWRPLPGCGGNLWSPFLWATQRRVVPGAYFHYGSYIPRADVSGDLIEGRRRIPVRGQGYHECGRANISIHRIFADWYWIRLFLGEVTILCAIARTTARALHAPLRALLVCDGRERIVDVFDPVGLRLTHAIRGTALAEGSGREYPRKFEVRARSRGYRIELALESFFERESLRFEDYSLDLPLRPHWMQHLVRAQGRIEGPGVARDLEGDGILETMLTGAA